MDLNTLEILGNSSIGIFSMATNSFGIFPLNLKKVTLKTVEDTLKIPIICTSIASSSLNGLFVVGNSSHLVLPGLIADDEYDMIKSRLPDNVDLNIFESKITALGNSIVCGDDVALVHKKFTPDEKNTLTDFLDVEIISGEIIGSPLVGSLVFRTDRGILTHPLITDEELDWLASIFKTNGDVVTVNRGLPYPRPGLVANSSGILAGSDTTGPELMRIYDILAN